MLGMLKKKQNTEGLLIVCMTVIVHWTWKGSQPRRLLRVDRSIKDNMYKNRNHSPSIEHFLMRSLSLWAILPAMTVLAAPLAAQTAPELSRIPANAALVVHLQAGAVYASPGMKEWRHLLARVHPRALQVFEERFLPAPEPVDRVTLVVMSPKFEADDEERPFAFMITTKAIVHSTAILERLDLKMIPVPAALVPTWIEEGDLNAKALAMPDSKFFIYGTKSLVKDLAAAPKDREPPAAFRGLDSFPFALLANAKGLPAWFRETLLAPAGAIGKVDTIRLTATFPPPITIDVQLNFRSDEDAVLAEDALNNLIRKRLTNLEEPRRQMLELLEKPKTGRPATFDDMPEALGWFFGLAAINQAEEMLKGSPIKRQGDRLAAKYRLPAIISPNHMAVGLLGSSLWTMAAIRADPVARRKLPVENLKQIGQAFHNYEEMHEHLPVDITDPKTGKPLLSWRVAILPFIGERALYKKFKLNESWDSDHNLEWAKTLVTTFQAPNQKRMTDRQGRVLTHYMVFVGDETLFPAGKKHRFSDILDGRHTTILCVEAKSPCIWTKPQDLPFAAKKDFPALDSFLGVTSEGFHVLLCDESTHWFKMNVDGKTMKALIMPTDGIPFEFPNSTGVP